jgi:hypothetical protein
MIGVCAKGKNIAAEIYGAKILPLSRVGEVLLSSPHLPLEYQSPFLRALHCIYFSTESSQKSGLKQASNDGAESL